MSDEWDFYFANVNDVLASLYVNLGLRDSVPDFERPWLLWAWVYFRDPRDDGLSSSEEAPKLFEIEDALTSAVKQLAEAELVGRITTAGRRELYFYGPRQDRFEEAVASALRNFSGYEFDSGTQKDTDWSQYLNVLYPSPEDHQRIKNRHVIEALEKHGDPLKVPRPVMHWAYFDSRDNRSKFIAQAVRDGFKLVDESKSDDSKLRYGATLERIDQVDWDSINDVTLELFRMAQKAGGEYDGWETSVEAD
jgi:regulator of RNase E activity RraB